MIELPDSNLPPTDAVTASQAKCNRSTQGQWGMYGGHRQAIERLIVPERRGGAICVLGAGNCNDLDLKWLTEMYAAVHLVDLDAEALRAGVAKQLGEGMAGVSMHAPFDLTGIAARVARWGKSAASVAEVEAATREAAGEFSVPWPACDVVLSPCVLTQTINPVRDALRAHYPASQPAVLALRAALRARHLRTVGRSLAPGGRGVLAIDLISSEKYPELARVPEDRLASLMRTFVADGKSYRGLDPASMGEAVRRDPAMAGVMPPQFTGPWLWHLGLRRSFLVYGMTFRKASPHPSPLPRSTGGEGARGDQKTDAEERRKLVTETE